jgi:TolB protein
MLLAGLVAGGSLVVGASTASATYPGQNGEIAVSVFPLPGCASCHNQIYVVRPNGTGMRRLTRSQLDDFSPAFSADGGRIVFAQQDLDADRSFSHIAVMRADGSGRQQLTQAHADDGTPQFSPDGRAIVFGRRGSDVAIYIMDAGGTHVRRLARNASAPAFSPDGRRIVFEGRDGDNAGIFMVRSDGSHLRQLTHSPLSGPDPIGNREYMYLDYTPSFSPDGKRIVFMRSGSQCVTGDIYVMSASGKHVHALTHGRDGLYCNDYSNPTFSPDGRRIAFSGYGHLYVMDSDGAHRRLLTERKSQYGAPDWQPLRGFDPAR